MIRLQLTVGIVQMALSTQPYKGARDFYPAEMAQRRAVFKHFFDLAKSHAFQEYDGPILEPFELYAAKTGEEIVNQQLYSFEDRGGRKVAIRPEMTPTLARMVAGKLGELLPPLKWYSLPNLWRYERPQKGRLREHWQFNVDILGGDTHLADLEILTFLKELFAGFGCLEKLRFRVNHRGWVNFYLAEVLKLSTEAAYSFSKVLDAKEKLSPEEFEEALVKLFFSAEQRKALEFYLSSSLDEMENKFPSSPVAEIARLVRSLDFAVDYDPLVMRGLDYYTGIVFEVFDRSPSNRRAVCGGGRYDNLIGMFGKQQLSGVGFGMGDVVLMDFLTEINALPKSEVGCDVFLSLPEESFWKDAVAIANVLRAKGLSVDQSLKTGAFKAQLKAADRSGARWAVLFGEDEWKEKKIVLRDLKNSSQEIFSLTDLAEKVFS